MLHPYTHKIRCTHDMYAPEDIEEEISLIQEEWNRFFGSGDFKTLSIVGTDLTILEQRLKNSRLYVQVCKERDEERAKTAR